MTAARQQMISKSAPVNMPVPSGLVNSKCTCSTACGECEECKVKRRDLQRKPGGWSETPEVPPIVHDVLQLHGKPLDASSKRSKAKPDASVM